MFQQAEARKKVASSPLRIIFGDHWQLVIAGVCIAAIAATGSITFQIFLSQFARQQLKLDAASSLTITAASLLFAAFWVWLIGTLSDRTGRKTMVLLSVGGFLLLTYPLLSLLTSSPSLTNLVIVQFAGAILYGTVFGVIPTLLPELVSDKRTLYRYLAQHRPRPNDFRRHLAVHQLLPCPVDWQSGCSGFLGNDGRSDQRHRNVDDKRSYECSIRLG